MRQKLTLLALVLAVACTVFAASAPKKDKPGDAVISSQDNSENLRVEGEKRFRANCGRCHAAPHKFPPRMMATIVRHMRVRATITDEDMRLVLLYMTQ